MSNLEADQGASDWTGAAQLIARMTVWIGLALVATGFGKAVFVLIDSSRGVETLATIDTATSRNVGGGGWVALSWRDAAGDMRRAASIEVSRNLGRKLRLGGSLTRTLLKIRYRPDEPRTSMEPTIVVVDDIQEHVKKAASLAIAGFLAIAAGSALVLGLLLKTPRADASVRGQRGFGATAGREPTAGRKP